MKKSTKKVLIITLFCTLVFLTIIYLGVSVFYQYHFLPGTVINGYKCSNKTVATVEEEMIDSVRLYNLTIEERLNTVEIIPSADIDMSMSIKGDLKEILKKQNYFSWLKYAFAKEETSYNADIHVTYNENMLDVVIGNLMCLNDENITGAVPATLEYSGGEFKIISGHAGNEINKDIAIAAIKNAIDTMETNLVLETVGCYISPLYTDEGQYDKLVETLNSYLDVKITLNFGDNEEIIDYSLINTWVYLDENNTICFKEDEIRAYLKTLADKYDSMGNSRTFYNALGTEITVSGGDYGWWLDGETECANIISDITTLNSCTRETAFKQRADVFSEVDFEKNYIEVNLATQKLYAIKDGELFHTADIVSGKSGYETPTGIFRMRFMFRDYNLVRPTLNKTVKYWMVFYGNTVDTNIGLCSCDWLSDFGGNIYKTNGSLGSVYMSNEDAKIIYENYPNDDFAVIIYNK